MLLLAGLVGFSTARTPIPVDRAEAACVRRGLSGGGPQGAFTLGIGTGYGGRVWGGGGAGIAGSTTVPLQTADPATDDANCVRGPSGEPPVTPCGQRPEPQG